MEHNTYHIVLGGRGRSGTILGGIPSKIGSARVAIYQMIKTMITKINNSRYLRTIIIYDHLPTTCIDIKTNGEIVL